MSEINETGKKAWVASEAITQFLRVTLSSGELAIAGANELDIGEVMEPVLAADDIGTVRMISTPGTHKMVCSAAVDAEARVYGAAGGKISATPNDNLIGIAINAGTANNDVIEVLRFTGGSVAGYGDDAYLAFGADDDVQLLWSDADASNHAFVVALGASQAMHITDVAAKASDWALDADTHPTLYLHSNTTPITDYLKIGVHDGSGAWAADMVGGAAIYLGFDGLECLELAETATAVNHLKVTNAATGNDPAIDAVGGDTDVGLTIAAKGAGDLALTAAAGDITLSCGIVAADTILLRAYDIDATAYKNMVAIASHATVPTIQICPTAAEQLGFHGATPVVQANHIADASGDDATAVNAILVVLENLGLVASS